MNRRYSNRQLALAKVLAVVLIGLAWGPFLAKTPEKRGQMILGAIVLVGLVAVFYESVARLLAVAIGRLAPPRPKEPEAFQPTGSLAVPLTVGDTAALFGWFLAAQFVVWVAAGVVAAVRAQELGEVAVQLEMVNVVPVALPISMAASGVVLLLALGRWRERLGPVTFDWVVAASRGSSRNLLLGAGVGVTLGVAIVLVGHLLEAKPTGTPNLLIQAMAKPGVGRWSFAVTAAVLAPPLEEDRLDPLEVQKMREHEPRRPSTDNDDLGARSPGHGSQPIVPGLERERNAVGALQRSDHHRHHRRALALDPFLGAARRPAGAQRLNARHALELVANQRREAQREGQGRARPPHRQAESLERRCESGDLVRRPLARPERATRGRRCPRPSCATRAALRS